MTANPVAERDVVIAGGGIAALEALIALHDLGEQRMRVTLVAPETTFRLRPMAVAVPFSAGHVTEVPLDEICRRFGATRLQTTLLSVDPVRHRVRCGDGRQLDYDALLVATGARAVPAHPAALTFSDAQPETLNGLLRDLEEGWSSSVAVVVPTGEAWVLPAYELALLISRDVRAAGMDVDVHLATPEPAALALFGPAAGAALATMLREAGVTLHTDAFAEVLDGGRLLILPDRRELAVERIVALPRLQGRATPGLPCDADGFLRTDEHGRVRGVDDVYAAGDGADFPVKHGGLAAQQADAAAQHIVATAGAPVEPRPFRPVLSGMLLTGGTPRFLHSEIAGGRGEAQIADHHLWWPPVKVVGRYLSQWLAGELGIAPEPPAGRHLDVEVPLRDERADPRPPGRRPRPRGRR